MWGMVTVQDGFIPWQAAKKHLKRTQIKQTKIASAQQGSNM